MGRAIAPAALRAHPQTSAPPSGALVAARNVSKTFGDKRVLSNLDLDILPGEVHGLLGQNGSGKSTFIKILSGFYDPDDGASLSINGSRVPLPVDPWTSRNLGLSFVHQDLALAGSMSVLENLRVSSFDTAPGWRIRWGEERRAVEAELARFGLEHVSPDDEVGRLREVERAMVAIIRALDRLGAAGGGVLVLDEPTVYLPRDGIERLFEAVRVVTAGGMGVLFVTHRLEEMRAITDRVTVLRDGASVLTETTAQVTDDEILAAIVGSALGRLYPPQHQVRDEVALAVRGLAGGAVDEFDLTVRQGEVVGLTGLLGMGHEDVPYLLFGASEARTGELSTPKGDHDLQTFTPRAAIESGMALLPANRLRDGGAPTATMSENVSLPRLPEYFSKGLLRLGREREDVSHQLRAMQVRPPDPDAAFGALSGGNQQKSLFAKWMATRPEVMLLHEPTQGVDIGARKEIFQQIRDMAEAGGAIIISSGEHEDLANLCDRVLVFRDGKVTSEIHRAALSEHAILEQCFAVAGRHPSPPANPLGGAA